MAEQRDLDAYQEFLSAYVERRFPSTLHRFLGASDIVQSVFRVAGSRMEQFRGSSEAEFRGWLTRIAQRKIIDSLRKYRLREHGPDPASSALATDLADHCTPEMEFTFTEQADVLIGAIESLPGEIQRIVTFRHVQNLTFDEIASRMQISVTTCRRRWLEGLQILESQLGDSI